MSDAKRSTSDGMGECFKIRLDNVVLENKIWFWGYKYQDYENFQFGSKFLLFCSHALQQLL